MNMKKCVYCGYFYDSDRSMTCSNCGQENPAVPQGNPTVPQENPSSGPAIAPGPVITPLHESGESFSGTAQSAATSGVCRVSDYRYSGPSAARMAMYHIISFFIEMGFFFWISFKCISFYKVTGDDKYVIAFLIFALIWPCLIFLEGFTIAPIFTARSFSFKLDADNIRVIYNGGAKSFISVNGLSRRYKSFENAKPFLTQLSMVDPVAYDNVKRLSKYYVFDVNGRTCRMFVKSDTCYLFIDGIKVVDSGVQVVYELPAKNS